MFLWFLQEFKLNLSIPRLTCSICCDREHNRKKICNHKHLFEFIFYLQCSTNFNFTMFLSCVFISLSLFLYLFVLKMFLLYVFTKTQNQEYSSVQRASMVQWQTTYTLAIALVITPIHLTLSCWRCPWMR